MVSIDQMMVEKIGQDLDLSDWEKERYEKSGYKRKTPAKTYRTGKSGAIKRALKIR